MLAADANRVKSAMAPRTQPGQRAASVSPPDRATVAAGFVTGLLAGLAERGLDRTGPLREAGIEARVLADPAARVPLPAYAALYDAVIRVHGDEGFALFASPLRPGTFEFLCRSCLGGDGWAFRWTAWRASWPS